MQRTETTLVLRFQIIINEENFIVAPWQLKKPASILSDECYEGQAFPYLPTSKFD